MTPPIGALVRYDDARGHYGDAVVVGGTNPHPDRYKRVGVRWISGVKAGEVRFPVVKNLTLISEANVEDDEVSSFFV